MDDRRAAVRSELVEPEIEIDVDGLFRSISTLLVDELGYTAAELIGKPALGIVDHRDRPDLVDVLTRIREDSRPGRVLFRALCADGTGRWLESTVRFDAGEGGPHYALIARDVSERVVMEERLEAQLADERRISELSRYFVGLPVDGIEAAIAWSLQSAGELARADRCSLLELPEGLETREIVRFDWCAEGIAARHPDQGEARWLGGDDGWIRRRLLAMEEVHVADAAALPGEAESTHRAFDDYGIRSYLGIPIGSGGRLVAYLDFDRVRVRAGWSEADRSRVRLIGDVLASALHRLRTEQARRHADQRLSVLASSAKDVICETDERGRVLYCTPSVEKVFGLGESEIRALPITELVDRRDLPRVEAAYRELFTNKSESVIVFRARHRDGQRLWLEARARAFERGDGRTIAISVIRDVTGRERQRASLEERFALESQLSRLSRDLLSHDADELELVMVETLAAAAATCSADRSYFISTMPSRGGDPDVFEWHEPHLAPYARSADHHRLDVLEWSTARLRQGAVIVAASLDDLPADAMVERTVSEQLGIRSYITVPALFEGELMGVLTLQSESRRCRFGAREINFLQIITDLMQGAIRRRQAQRALRDSEERYRSLAENSKDCICELSESGRYLWVSPSFARLLGRDRHQLEREAASLIVHPDDLEMVRRNFLGLIGRGNVDPLIYRAAHADGSWRWLETSAQSFRTAAGEIRAVAVMRDVTERELSRKALGRQLELESRVADLSRYFLDLDVEDIEPAVRSRLADLASLARAEHSWIYFFSERRSEQTESYEWWDPVLGDRGPIGTDFDPEVYGWTYELFESGRSIHVPSPESLPERAAAERQTLSQRGVRSMLGIPLQTAGVAVGFLGFETFTHQRDWSGEITTLLRLAGEIFVSALRRRRVEGELRRSQLELLQSQKMDAVGRLAGGIAHDFNNHLAVMLGNVRYARGELDAPEDIEDALADVERSAEHCSQLTRSLLTFSRRSPVRIKPLDVRNFLECARDLVGPLVPASLTLSIQADDDVDAVAADATQLQQVIVNVIVNARDAMPRGGEVFVTAHRRIVGKGEYEAVGLPAPGEYVELRVRDTGSGMSDAIQSRIFEPFFTTKDVGEGTGLGLATVYGIVEQSDGAIEVESAPGEGTTFRILLPTCADIEDALEAGRGGVATGGHETILLAEDQPAVRRLLERILRAGGYRVLVTANGDEALDAAAAHGGPIHFLISDLVMPGMGGLELAERLRGRDSRIGVLFLSGNTIEYEHVIDERVPGAARMQKPFREEELLAQLRALLDETGPHA